MTKHFKMDNEQENDTLTNETELETPESPEPEKAEKSKEFQSAIAQKEHFREKAEKLEKELAELRAKPSNPSPEPKTGNFDPIETVKIAKLLNQFNDDESEFILGRAGQSSYEAIKKAAEDKWTQVAIQGMREKVKAEVNVPSPTSPGSRFGTKEITPETKPVDVEKITREKFTKVEHSVEGGI